MIEFKCPQCGEDLSVPSCLAGQSERCLHCRQTVRVPVDTLAEGASVNLDAIIQSLQSPDAKVRVEGADALGRCGGPHAVEMLVKAFRDDNKFVREQVMDSLRRIGDPEGVAMLARKLGGQWASEALVHETVRGLVKFGPKAAGPLIDILAEINKHPYKYEPETVRAAVMILGRLGEKAAIELLAKMFRRHFDIQVRDEAAYSLAMIGKPGEWHSLQGEPADRRRGPARELAKQVMRENHILA